MTGTTVIYSFKDEVGKIGELQLDEAGMKLLARQPRSDETAVTVVLHDVNRHEIIVGPAPVDAEGSYAIIDLSSGGAVRVSQETYEKFIDDVQNERPGVYAAVRV
jgi:hypothetical protein